MQGNPAFSLETSFSEALSLEMQSHSESNEENLKKSSYPHASQWRLLQMNAL